MRNNMVIKSRGQTGLKGIYSCGVYSNAYRYKNVIISQSQKVVRGELQRWRATQDFLSYQQDIEDEEIMETK